MKYRIDLVLNPNKEIDIFRQTLTNNSNEPVMVTLTNIAKNELIRGIKFLVTNSERLINEKVMPEGNAGIVDFKVYDNPKRIGSRRNITFTDSVSKNDYMCKFIDTTEKNTRNGSYFDTKHDISVYLRCAGNPDNAFSTNAEEEIVTPEEIVVIPETETPVKDIIENVEEVIETFEDATTTYSKGKDGKFYCPFVDCEKHTEGYATERAMKNHMTKVHDIEC